MTPRRFPPRGPSSNALPRLRSEYRCPRASYMPAIARRPASVIVSRSMLSVRPPAFTISGLATTSPARTIRAAELRMNCERLHCFAEIPAVEALLNELAERSDGALARPRGIPLPTTAIAGISWRLTQAEDVSDYITSLVGRKHEHWHPRMHRPLFR
jgi:hypothetical protein